MADVVHNAFSGNPLIPGKQDKATLPKLLPLLSSAASAGGEASRCVLPVSNGKILVWSRQEQGTNANETQIRWGLGWQALSVLGIPVPVLCSSESPPGQEASADVEAASATSSGHLRLEDLIYLGEARGRPYFAVEIPLEASSKVPSISSYSAPSPAMQQQWESPGAWKDGTCQPGTNGGAIADSEACLSFVDMRTLLQAGEPGNSAQMADLAIAGQARALAEWHKQTKFCSRCGSPTAPSEAGSRRSCTSSTCGAKVYPRVDPVVIMLIVDRSRDQVVLGRQPRFPQGMWSCLAGFMEVGESMEEAVAREVREEVGLTVSRVAYHSSQPWPVGLGNMLYQLMVGFYAEVSTFDITIDKTELEDARWFSQEEVKAGLNFQLFEQQRKESCDRIHASRSLRDDKEVPPKLPQFYAPGPYAIAHVLLKDWAFSGPNDVPNQSCL